MSERLVPRRIFFTKGKGVDTTKLGSFEMALRDAGIEKQNLVYVSSIFPAGCKEIKREDGVKELLPGEITYVVLARAETDENQQLVATSIGVAIPTERESQYGYLSEHHSHGETADEAGDFAEDLAATMLAKTLGIEFDVAQAWDEKETVFKTSGRIFATKNITQSAQGKRGMWTTVIAAAVLLFGDLPAPSTDAPLGNDTPAPADPPT